MKQDASGCDHNLPSIRGRALFLGVVQSTSTEEDPKEEVVDTLLSSPMEWLLQCDFFFHSSLVWVEDDNILLFKLSN